MQLAFAIVFVVVLCSCSFNNESQVTDDSVTLVEDTLANVTEEVSEPEPKSLSFNSADEAIRYMEESEDSEKYLSGILPQMAKDELSYCTKLLDSDHPHFFIVDKAMMEIVVFDRYGREEKRVGMACSKNYGTKHKRRDNRTPEGFFTAKGVYNSTEWLYTDDDGKTSDVKGQFGPRFIRLNIPVTTQIGIHGTVAPWSIGHRRSHGCIRVTNENIMDLVQYVDSGMPVIVSPGSRDMVVNEQEGYYIPSVSTRRNGAKATPHGYSDPTVSNKTNDTTVTTSDSIQIIESSEEIKPTNIPDTILNDINE